jgi:hypothetical protein
LITSTVGKLPEAYAISLNSVVGPERKTLEDTQQKISEPMLRYERVMLLLFADSTVHLPYCLLVRQWWARQALAQQKLSPDCSKRPSQYIEHGVQGS